MVAERRRPRLLGTFGQWAALALCVALGAGLFAFVDLEPKVQADFFFSTDDPQIQESQKIEKEFGEAQQIFIAARSSNLVSKEYLERLYKLTEDLRKIKGVADVRSLTHGPEKPEEILEEDADEVYEDLAKSPFWSRLLLAPDRSATFVVMRLDGKNQAATIAQIDRVLDRHSRRGFQLGTSGVPYVAEHVRQRLSDDLRTFSIAAFAAFALLVTILFRSISVLIGTTVAAFTACFGTFIVRDLAGMPTDILMPNLWTIAFVLTLSHVVYLTAEWRRSARENGENAVAESIRTIAPASIWSLVANLLGFASLIFVSAKPLRQFGISGAIAAVLAILCAYFLYPVFLRSANPRTAHNRGTITGWLDRFFTSRHRIVAMCAVAVALVLAPFAWRVNTDPSLPSYFSSDDRIRTGLSAIDRAAGSSPLDIVVADASGAALDDDDAFERLEALQHRLEKHKDVGSVLSIALLMAEAERPWYSFLFSWETKFERLESPKHGRVGRTFITEDRRHGRFILRMRESARSRPREAVIGEIQNVVRKHGFKSVHVGGLYPAQGELSKLVEGSVICGLGGLLACFFVISWIVSRSFRTALAMGLCLALTPFAIFGFVGLAGMPLDIISAPAANVALPMGIDEMIHLGHTVRRLRKRAQNTWQAWRTALEQLWAPILISMLIVTSGFALFLLSSFPPTRRLGVLVLIGAAITDLVVLVVLPAIATFRRKALKPREAHPIKAA